MHRMVFGVFTGKTQVKSQCTTLPNWHLDGKYQINPVLLVRHGENNGGNNHESDLKEKKIQRTLM